MRFLDETVSAEGAAGRATIVTRALARERRRLIAEGDARIYAEYGDEPELAEFTRHAATTPGRRLMLPIHVVTLDKARPAVVLTREAVRRFRNRVMVAPITSTIRGLSTEVQVDEASGLDHESVVSLDNITTVPVDCLGQIIGYLTPEQDRELAYALIAAFDLDVLDTRGEA